MPVTQTMVFSATPPTTGETPTTFNANAIACWVDLKDNIVPDLNTAFSQMNTLETNVNAKEVSAVAASAIAVAANNFKGIWSGQLTSISPYESWLYNDVIYMPLVAGTDSPITTPSNWFALTIMQAIKNTPYGGVTAINGQGAINELDDKKAPKASPIFTGTVSLESSIVFEGATVDSFQTTLTAVDPSVDNTLTLPNKSGTMATTDDIKQIQPATVTVSANALTVTLNPTTLDFRSTTLNDGTVITVTIAAPISLTVPDTGTLGTISGVMARLAVVVMNNGGVGELAIVNTAGGNDLSEAGLISTTTLDTSSDANNLFYSTNARTSLTYRVVGLIDITEATAGTWATGPTLVQGIGGQAVKLAMPNKSQVRLNTANGYGSTNTCIRRFLNVVDYIGNDITYADSATLGATFTINTSGIYNISSNDQFVGASHFGASLNSTQLSTPIGSITVANILTAGYTPSANVTDCCSMTLFLKAGDVVRAHTGGAASGTTTNLCQFTISRVG